MNLIDQLDIQDLKVDNNGFSAFIELNEFHAQPQGFLNGGVSLAFAEIVAGMASMQLLDEGYFAVGQNINANHLNSIKASGELYANGVLLKKGGRNHVWEIKLVDESGALVSAITVVNAILKK